MIVIELHGKPVAKGRPRFGRGHAYTPAKTRAYEKSLGWAAKVAMQGKPPLAGPLTVRALIELEPPSSWSKTKQRDALGGMLYPTTRPDVDNYNKIIFDALNSIVWLDDSQIVDSHISKRYGLRAGVRIEIDTIG